MLTAIRNAAIAVVAGATISTALYVALRDQDVTCQQWTQAVDQLNQRYNQYEFYVATKQGVAIPKAIGNRLIGDCAAGECTIKPDNCDAQVKWSYKVGPLTDLGALGSWRLNSVLVPKYIAGSLKAWATSDPSNVKFFASHKEAITKCLTATTRAKCLELFDVANKCLLQNDGFTCTDGRRYGPGMGGTTPCEYAKVVSTFPCESLRGAGSEFADAEKTFTDEELDSLE